MAPRERFSPTPADRSKMVQLPPSADSIPERTVIDLDPVPGDAQRKVLEVVAPIQVANGDIASQEAADTALSTLLYPDFAKKADPGRVG